MQFHRYQAIKFFFHRIHRLIYVISPHSPLILHNFALNDGDFSIIQKAHIRM